MRVSEMQSAQCRLQGTVVSVIIVFVLDFSFSIYFVFLFRFSFVLVFVNENHTGSVPRKFDGASDRFVIDRKKLQ